MIYTRNVLFSQLFFPHDADSSIALKLWQSNFISHVQLFNVISQFRVEVLQLVRLFGDSIGGIFERIITCTQQPFKCKKQVYNNTERGRWCWSVHVLHDDMVSVVPPDRKSSLHHLCKRKYYETVAGARAAFFLISKKNTENKQNSLQVKIFLCYHIPLVRFPCNFPYL